MKTNYLPKNKSRSSYFRKILFLAGVFLVGALAIWLIRPFILSAATPLWRSENVVIRVIKKGFEHWQSRQNLVNENFILKEKVASLELEISALSAEVSQEELLLAIGRTGGVEGVIASVLVRPPQSPYDSLIIDAGSNAGVRSGAAAVTPEGIALGVVAEVYPKESRVKLLSSSGEKTEAILERHGVPVALEGKGAGNFRIVVPRETAVEVGDKVLTAGTPGRFVAVVGDVTLEATDAFKEVLAQTPVSIFSIRFVSILK